MNLQQELALERKEKQKLLDRVSALEDWINKYKPFIEEFFDADNPFHTKEGKVAPTRFNEIEYPVLH